PETAVGAFGEALQIDLVGNDPGAKKVKDLGSGIAVGDEGTGQAGGVGLAEDIDGPLGGDQRLVVAGDDQPGAFALGDADQLRGSPSACHSSGAPVTVCRSIRSARDSLATRVFMMRSRPVAGAPDWFDLDGCGFKGA